MTRLTQEQHDVLLLFVKFQCECQQHDATCAAADVPETLHVTVY